MAVSLKQAERTKINEENQVRPSFELTHPVYSKLRSPLILGHKSYAEVTGEICQLLDPRPGREIGRAHV